MQDTEATMITSRRNEREAVAESLEHLDLWIDGGILLNILVFCRNVGFRLVIIVIRDKIFDPVVREKITELLVELGGKSLVMGKHQRWPVPGGDHVCHRERLALNR